MQDRDVVRIKGLFNGNPLAYGIYDEGKAYTKREAVLRKHFEEHLNGKRGLGIVPVIDEHTSGFGVLDFDNHKEKNGVDLAKLARKIKALNAPLVLCRSKSGGAHVFLFGDGSLNTKVLRQTLNSYKSKLSGVGELEIEIFPKQDKVDENKVGNWINLPYLNNENTERYCFLDGKPLSLDNFLTYAESKRISNNQLIALHDPSHDQAPPCIQTLLKIKSDKGGRNTTLYNFCVYARKAFPETWDKLSFKFNEQNFNEPLDYQEVTSVIESVRKQPDYKYKCHEEPCKSHCDSNQCVKLRYGITPSEKNEILMETLPKFGILKKYITEPLRYELSVGDKTLVFSSAELLDHRHFRRLVFEQLDQVINPMKNTDWLPIVKDMMESMVHVDVPDDASRAGIIRSLLEQFIMQADLKDNGEDKDKRALLVSGSPVVQKLPDKKRYVLFKGMKFRQFIQNKRLGNLAGTDIYMSVKEMGVKEKAIRHDDKVIKVWTVPLKDDTTKTDLWVDEDIVYEDELNSDVEIIESENISGTQDIFEAEF